MPSWSLAKGGARVKRHAEDERRWAVARGDAGDQVTLEAVALGRSRDGVYTGCTRARSGDPAWAQDGRIADNWRGPRWGEVVEAVRLVRLSLYNQGLLCAREHPLGTGRAERHPAPSVRTINRILARGG
jgi:hypothetical protein